MGYLPSQGMGFMAATTSREELLEGAYRIAEAHGIAALSVRGLATECSVSVGTVYNYFGSKKDLVVDTVELFFRRAFFEEFCRLEPEVDFGKYCRNLFSSMETVLDRFRSNWLKGVGALPEAELVAARAREAAQFKHALHGLQRVFESDPRIDRASLPECVDSLSVSTLVLNNLLNCLRTSNATSIPAFFWMLEQALYPKA